MAEYDNRVLRGQTATVDVVDQGLRAYMLRVYNYMLVGLVLTGLASYGFTLLTTTSDPALASKMLPNGVMLTALGATVYGTPWMWAVILAPVAVYLFIYVRLQHLSAVAAQSAFWLYAALVGVSFSSIFIVYTASSIAQVFFVTAAAFGGLSLWGYTTKKDLTGFGSFLIMGAWGLFIALIVNMFLKSDMMAWVTSIAGVGIFAGLTAYDTQKIKEIYYVGDDGTVAARKSVMGALVLYLDFINMFLFLLRLMGSRR